MLEQELIAKLQASTGPDPVIDLGLQWSVLKGYRHLGNHHYEHPKTLDLKVFKPGGAQRFTERLDAAITLLPAGLFWVITHARVGQRKTIFEVMIRRQAVPGFSTPAGTGEHPTSPAIAFCIAALDARLLLAVAKRRAA